MTHIINRRKALAVVAAVPAAAALATPALARVGEDAELRELWAKYLVQFAAYVKAWDAAKRLRKASGYDAESDAIRAKFQGSPGDLHRLLWKKHGLEPLYATATREHRKALRIVKAIRKAKAESLFGIGVKLSAWEDWEGISDEEFAEVVDGVRRDIAALIGVDFIAATDELEA
jgi:hypothetical protein